MFLFAGNKITGKSHQYMRCEAVQGISRSTWLFNYYHDICVMLKKCDNFRWWLSLSTTLPLPVSLVIMLYALNLICIYADTDSLDKLKLASSICNADVFWLECKSSWIYMLSL